MKTLLLILRFLLFLLVISSNSNAQTNLVPNSSFEDYFNINANGNLLENFIYNWYGGLGYFHANRSDAYYSVPTNGIGYQNAHYGNAYCGIYTYGKYTSPIRQYIQTKLTDNLLNGKKYIVSFYVSLGDTLHAYNNSIGAYFAADSVLLYSNGGLFNLIPQIQNDSGNVLNSKTVWTFVCDTFVANGSERWMTIGNFLTDSLSLISELDTVCDQPNPFGCGAYYFIDDVSVKLIDETSIEELDENKYNLFPNPNIGCFRLQYNGTLTATNILSISDIFGTKVDQIEIINTTTEYENRKLKNGLYFYTLRQGSEELGRGKFMVIH
jgi:OOP family OmpA-OmpF porin